MRRLAAAAAVVLAAAAPTAARADAPVAPPLCQPAVFPPHGDIPGVYDCPPYDSTRPLACQVLAVVFPPHGDVPGVQDCPPYGA